MEIDSIIIQREIYLKLLMLNLFLKYTQQSNFILIKVDDANRRYDELIAKESLFGIEQHNLCENCLRLTIGTAEENKKLMEALVTLKT
jgi:histidinol-phosphate aminotransferase